MDDDPIMDRTIVAADFAALLRKAAGERADAPESSDMASDETLGGRPPAAPAIPDSAIVPEPAPGRAHPLAPELDELPEKIRAALSLLAREILAAPRRTGRGEKSPRQKIESAAADIDARMTGQLNLVLHHPEFQALEAAWRGLHYLARQTDANRADGGQADAGAVVKIRVLNISKHELNRSLRKFRGTAWDQSPVFKLVYEEEYGQLGGEPFGVLVADYEFDHRAEDVRILADMAAIAAAAHAPFIAAAAPSLMQMDSWAELANPRDLTRIFATPEYAGWRALRDGEDSRYLGLVMPRMLARVPYGPLTDPVDDFYNEEEVEGPDARAYPWMSAVWGMAANIARAFALYGWCARIHGIETGGIVDGLPTLRFPTADGDTDIKCIAEIALNERREAELSRAGLIALAHRKNSDAAAFISAHSLQRPMEYDDEAASANAVLSARLTHIFASCRFAHFLKCMVRDKVGSSMSRAQLEEWLNDWLRNYVDGSSNTSTEEWKATHPLEAAEVAIEEIPDKPGHYESKFYLRPHYQLEGLTVALRLVSRMPAP